MEEKNKILLLDLGNVIFHLDFVPFQQWLVNKGTKSAEEAWTDMMPIYLDYEKGFFSDDEFLEKTQKVLSFTFQREDFLEMWRTCWKKDMEGMEELLDHLPDHIKPYSLTNTNALHIDYFLKTKPILKKFIQIFKSHEMHLAKPDPRIYQGVLDELKVDAEQVVFFDDLNENVDAAKKLGLSAHVFESAQQIREVMF